MTRAERFKYLYGRARWLINHIDDGGPLHILVADGNTDDASLSHCIQAMFAEDRPLQPMEVELLGMLQLMEEAERDALFKEEE